MFEILGNAILKNFHEWLLIHEVRENFPPPKIRSTVYSTTSRISLLLTLILGFASELCNNNDILLVMEYNYNIY